MWQYGLWQIHASFSSRNRSVARIYRIQNFRCGMPSSPIDCCGSTCYCSCYVTSVCPYRATACSNEAQASDAHTQVSDAEDSHVVPHPIFHFFCKSDNINVTHVSYFYLKKKKIFLLVLFIPDILCKWRVVFWNANYFIVPTAYLTMQHCLLLFNW